MKIQIDGITNKMGQIRKTAHCYEQAFDGDFGQIRKNIIVESTWLGYFEPYTTATINSYIYEMMAAKNQREIIREYNLEPFEVFVLKVERTLCEKIMSLVRFSQTEHPLEDLRNKIRHTYDIHMILENADYNNFFRSDEFDTMLLKVANDDVVSFKNNNDWLANHPFKVLLFSDTTDTWNQIKNTYTTSFKDLVFGKFPDEADILKTLIAVSKRLETVEWNIEIDRIE